MVDRLHAQILRRELGLDLFLAPLHPLLPLLVREVSFAMQLSFESLVACLLCKINELGVVWPGHCAPCQATKNGSFHNTEAQKIDGVPELVDVDPAVLVGEVRRCGGRW